MNYKNSFIQSLLFVALAFSGTSSLAQIQNGTTSISEVNETEIQELAQEPDATDPQNQEIKFDEDELPGESVTPKTDITTAVVNKSIKFSKRFLVDFNIGSILDEPLINSSYFLIRTSYFATEEYSFGLGLRSRFGGKSSYSQQLFEGSAQLDFDRAPAPTQSHFVSFGYNFYYGKISIAKNIVIPASTRLESDFGMQKIGGSDRPFVEAAINQSFYINKNMSFGISLGLSLSQSFDPTSVNIRLSQPVPKETDFTEKIQFNQYLSANLSTLF